MIKDLDLDLRIPENSLTEFQYNPGDIVAYYEDDAVSLVAVLENCCEQNRISYKLRNLKTIRGSSFAGWGFTEGYEFSMDRSLEYNGSEMAYLRNVIGSDLEKLARELVSN